LSPQKIEKLCNSYKNNWDNDVFNWDNDVFLGLRQFIVDNKDILELEESEFKKLYTPYFKIYESSSVQEALPRDKALGRRKALGQDAIISTIEIKAEFEVLKARLETSLTALIERHAETPSGSSVSLVAFQNEKLIVCSLGNSPVYITYSQKNEKTGKISTTTKLLSDLQNASARESDLTGLALSHSVGDLGGASLKVPVTRVVDLKEILPDGAMAPMCFVATGGIYADLPSAENTKEAGKILSSPPVLVERFRLAHQAVCESPAEEERVDKRVDTFVKSLSASGDAKASLRDDLGVIAWDLDELKKVSAGKAWIMGVLGGHGSRVVSEDGKFFLTQKLQGQEVETALMPITKRWEYLEALLWDQKLSNTTMEEWPKELLHVLTGKHITNNQELHGYLEAVRKRKPYSHMNLVGEGEFITAFVNNTIESLDKNPLVSLKLDLHIAARLAEKGQKDLQLRTRDSNKLVFLESREFPISEETNEYLNSSFKKLKFIYERLLENLSGNGDIEEIDTSFKMFQELNTNLLEQYFQLSQGADVSENKIKSLCEKITGSFLENAELEVSTLDEGVTRGRYLARLYQGVNESGIPSIDIERLKREIEDEMKQTLGRLGRSESITYFSGLLAGAKHLQGPVFEMFFSDMYNLAQTYISGITSKEYNKILDMLAKQDALNVIKEFSKEKYDKPNEQGHSLYRLVGNSLSAGTIKTLKGIVNDFNTPLKINKDKSVTVLEMALELANNFDKEGRLGKDYLDTTSTSIKDALSELVEHGARFSESKHAYQLANKFCSYFNNFKMGDNLSTVQSFLLDKAPELLGVPATSTTPYHDAAEKVGKLGHNALEVLLETESIKKTELIKVVSKEAAPADPVRPANRTPVNNMNQKNNQKI
jgi:hypothetical protein